MYTRDVGHCSKSGQLRDKNPVKYLGFFYFGKHGKEIFDGYPAILPKQRRLGMFYNFQEMAKQLFEDKHNFA